MVIGKTIIVDGKKFISEDALVEAMVKACVRYTNTENVIVDEYEAARVSHYQSFMDEMPELSSTMNKFKEKYVSERFINRTLEV